MGLIVRIAAASQKRAGLVVVVALLLAGLGLNYCASHLSVDTDTNNLFAASLPWRQAQMAEDKNFPQFDRLIVAVVRGATPEEAAETAAALNAALRADKTNFHDSDYPAGNAFYTREGLLLLPPTQLAKLLTSVIAAQPFLGQLAADPSARGLLNGIGLLAQGVQMGRANLQPYDAALRGVATSLQAAADGHPVPLSWQSLIGGNLGGDAEFVLAHPVLDNSSLTPGGVATAALKRIAAALPDVKAGRVTVDYTGQIPLADEQFASLTQGMVVGGIVSVLLISLWLFLALRSWRLIVPILATLVLGLVYTITFAAVAIGVMNLISVAFAILFIGLAVDFAIQYCVRLRDVRHETPELGAAIIQTARVAGGQIALAAAATACGFLAFAPTDFVGVAELGIIAGVGMLLAFICTITFLPALLRLLRPREENFTIGLPYGVQTDRLLRRHQKPVLIGFAVLALAGAVAAVTIGFDANPLNTKDPASESMVTLHRLLDNPTTNPFYADAMVPDLAAASALSQKLSALPQVASVISGATFIPSDQAQKLAMLNQAETILAPTIETTNISQTGGGNPVTAQDIRLSMVATRDAILKVKDQLPANSPVLGIANALTKLIGEDDAHVMAMNGAVTRFLPAELQRLNVSLGAQEITRQNLPASIARDWFLPNGEVKVEAFPTAASQTTTGLRAFSSAVLAVAPNAGGPAISTIATAGTILESFREAALLASIAIAVILFLVFRNIRDMALVIMTLALSGLLTALFAKLAGLEINYANIIALPLLLGVGVSFNVYFVMNFRAGMRNFLSSATAHAVLFSALTTGTAFGTLAASHDRGTASMGYLLLLSLLAVLIATFIFLPALLYRLQDAGKTQL
ncbi:MAG: RND transporter [Acidocella sp. 20-57-95]|nr:MAG: RND transporter [Acidocella sp. 20-57-95]OYV60106.1 MAG: RND transporter [Acidocella sp. 21-58-7]